MRARSLVAVALACLAMPAVAAQSPKPKPLPREEAAKRTVLPAQLLLVLDDEALVAIDARPAVRMAAGRHRVAVALGSHYLELRSVRAPDVVSQQTVAVEKPGQVVVTVNLKTKADEALRFAQPAFTGRLAAPGQTLLLVEPQLAAAIRPHESSVRAAALDLEVAPVPFAGRPLPSVVAGQAHAEITETAAPVVSALKMDGFDMQSCAVTLVVRHTAGTPAAVSVAGTGAAFSAAEACTAARHQAMPRALSWLIKSVPRKDTR